MNWVYYLFCLKLYKSGRRTSPILWKQVNFMFPGLGGPGPSNKKIFDFYYGLKTQL